MAPPQKNSDFSGEARHQGSERQLIKECQNRPATVVLVDVSNSHDLLSGPPAPKRMRLNPCFNQARNRTPKASDTKRPSKEHSISSVKVMRESSVESVKDSDPILSMYTVNSKQKKPYTCTTCSQRFTVKSGVLRHLLVHLDEKTPKRQPIEKDSLNKVTGMDDEVLFSSESSEDENSTPVRVTKKRKKTVVANDLSGPFSVTTVTLPSRDAPKTTLDEIKEVILVNAEEATLVKSDENKNRDANGALVRISLKKDNPVETVELEDSSDKAIDKRDITASSQASKTNAQSEKGRTQSEDMDVANLRGSLRIAMKKSLETEQHSSDLQEIAEAISQDGDTDSETNLGRPETVKADTNSTEDSTELETPTSRKKVRSWTDDQLHGALNDIWNNGKSVKWAAAYYKIPQPSLEKYAHGQYGKGLKEKIQKSKNSNPYSEKALAIFDLSISHAKGLQEKIKDGVSETMSHNDTDRTPSANNEHPQKLSRKYGPKRTWTDDQLHKALNDIWNNDVSLDDAATLHNIPKASLNNYLHEKVGKGLKTKIKAGVIPGVETIQPSNLSQSTIEHKDVVVVGKTPVLKLHKVKIEDHVNISGDSLIVKGPSLNTPVDSQVSFTRMSQRNKHISETHSILNPFGQGIEDITELDTDLSVENSSGKELNEATEVEIEIDLDESEESDRFGKAIQSSLESRSALKRLKESKGVKRKAEAAGLNHDSAKKLVVYCVCRKPAGKGMIGCDFCTEWYHPDCLNLTKSEMQQLVGIKWCCPSCKSKSNSKSPEGVHEGKSAAANLTKPLIKSERITPPPNFNCKTCSKSFPSKSDLKDHELRHFNGSANDFHCRKCKKQFMTRGLLKVHEASFCKKNPEPKHSEQSTSKSDGILTAEKQPGNQSLALKPSHKLMTISNAPKPNKKPTLIEDMPVEMSSIQNQDNLVEQQDDIWSNFFVNIKLQTALCARCQTAKFAMGQKSGQNFVQTQEMADHLRTCSTEKEALHKKSLGVDEQISETVHNIKEEPVTEIDNRETVTGSKPSMESDIPAEKTTAQPQVQNIKIESVETPLVSNDQNLQAFQQSQIVNVESLRTGQDSPQNVAENLRSAEEKVAENSVVTPESLVTNLESQNPINSILESVVKDPAMLKKMKEVLEFGKTLDRVAEWVQTTTDAKSSSGFSSASKHSPGRMSSKEGAESNREFTTGENSKTVKNIPENQNDKSNESSSASKNDDIENVLGKGMSAMDLIKILSKMTNKKVRRRGVVSKVSRKSRLSKLWLRAGQKTHKAGSQEKPAVKLDDSETVEESVDVCPDETSNSSSKNPKEPVTIESNQPSAMRESQVSEKASAISLSEAISIAEKNGSAVKVNFVHNPKSNQTQEDSAGNGPENPITLDIDSTKNVPKSSVVPTSKVAKEKTSVGSLQSKSWTEEKLHRALEDIWVNGMSVGRASKLYAIPLTTISFYATERIGKGLKEKIMNGGAAGIEKDSAEKNDPAGPFSVTKKVLPGKKKGEEDKSCAETLKEPVEILSDLPEPVPPKNPVQDRPKVTSLIEAIDSGLENFVSNEMPKGLSSNGQGKTLSSEKPVEISNAPASNTKPTVNDSMRNQLIESQINRITNGGLETKKSATEEATLTHDKDTANKQTEAYVEDREMPIVLANGKTIPVSIRVPIEYSNAAAVTDIRTTTTTASVAKAPTHKKEITKVLPENPDVEMVPSGSWTWRQMANALCHVKAGTMSQNEAARTYNIPQTTISAFVLGKRKLPPSYSTIALIPPHLIPAEKVKENSSGQSEITTTTWTNQQFQRKMADALKDVKLGGMAQKEAALKHNIPLSTLSSYVLGKYSIDTQQSKEARKPPSNEPGKLQSWMGSGKNGENSTEMRGPGGHKRSWTNQQMSDALEDIKIRKLSHAEAAKKHNIPISTLNSYNYGKFTLSNDTSSKCTIDTQKEPPQSTGTSKLYGNGHGKKRAWTNQQMADAMNDVKLRKMSLSEAAKPRNIPTSTLAAFVVGRCKLPSNDKPNVQNSKPTEDNSNKQVEPKSTTNTPSTNLRPEATKGNKVEEKWTEDQLYNALDSVWNNKMTIEEASTVHKVPLSTLNSYCNGKLGKGLKSKIVTDSGKEDTKPEMDLKQAVNPKESESKSGSIIVNDQMISNNQPEVRSDKTSEPDAEANDLKQAVNLRESKPGSITINDQTIPNNKPEVTSDKTQETSAEAKTAPSNFQRRSWTDAQLHEALNEIWNHGMSVGRAAKLHKIPLTTLSFYATEKCGKGLKSIIKKGGSEMEQEKSVASDPAGPFSVTKKILPKPKDIVAMAMKEVDTSALDSLITQETQSGQLIEVPLTDLNELLPTWDFPADQQANSADGQFDIDLNFGHTTNNGATFTQEQSSLINEIPVTADLDLVTEAVLQEINKPDPMDPTIAQCVENTLTPITNFSPEVAPVVAKKSLPLPPNLADLPEASRHQNQERSEASASNLRQLSNSEMPATNGNVTTVVLPNAETTPNEQLPSAVGSSSVTGNQDLSSYPFIQSDLSTNQNNETLLDKSMPNPFELMPEIPATAGTESAESSTTRQQAEDQFTHVLAPEIIKPELIVSESAEEFGYEPTVDPLIDVKPDFKHTGSILVLDVNCKQKSPEENGTSVEEVSI